MTEHTPMDLEGLSYEEAEKLALRAVHDEDGRGMVGRGRNHLHQRVARAILQADRLRLSQVRDLRGENEAAMREALSLANYLHRRFYSEVTQWRPLSDPAGVLSQADNMLAGVVQRLEAAEASLSANPSSFTREKAQGGER